MRGLRAFEEAGVIRLRIRHRVQLRHHHTGIDRVDAHAERRHLDRRATGEVIDARFAHAIRQHAGERSQAVDARHVHDGAFPRGEVRRGGAHQPERRPHIHRHHRVPDFVGRRLERAAGDDPRGVYQHVDAAERVERRLDDSLGCVGGRDVRATGDRLSPCTAHGTSHFSQDVFLASDQYDRRTVATKRLGCCAADATGRSGHDDGFSVE